MAKGTVYLMLSGSSGDGTGPEYLHIRHHILHSGAPRRVGAFLSDKLTNNVGYVFAILKSPILCCSVVFLQEISSVSYRISLATMQSWRQTASQMPLTA